MKKIVVIILFVLCIKNINAQVGIGFHPVSKSISFKSSMNRRWFVEAKTSFEIANSLLYSLRPSINYRIMNRETVKFYTGLGINFELNTRSLVIPFSVEVFPFERMKTLSLNLESGLNFLLIPGYTKMNIIGDFGITYYFDKKEKKKPKNE